jgi:hypothetical protein
VTGASQEVFSSMELVLPLENDRVWAKYSVLSRSSVNLMVSVLPFQEFLFYIEDGVAACSSFP